MTNTLQVLTKYIYIYYYLYNNTYYNSEVSIMNFDITLLTPAYLDTRFANYRLMNKYKVHMYTKGGVQPQASYSSYTTKEKKEQVI